MSNLTAPSAVDEEETMDVAQTPEQALASAREWLHRAREEPDETNVRLVRRRLTEAGKPPEEIGANEAELRKLSQREPDENIIDIEPRRIAPDRWRLTIQVARRIIKEKLVTLPIEDGTGQETASVWFQMELPGIDLEELPSRPDVGNHPPAYVKNIPDIACGIVCLMKQLAGEELSENHRPLKTPITEDAAQQCWDELVRRLEGCGSSLRELGLEEAAVERLLEKYSSSSAA